MQFLPGSVFIEDLEGRFLAINNYGAKKIIGLKHPNEIIGRSHSEIEKMGTWRVTQEEMHAWQSAKKQAMLEEKAILGVLFDPYLTADGSLILQTGSTFPLYDKKGKVVGSFSIALDATSKVCPEAIYRAYQALYPNKKQALQHSLKHLTGEKYPYFKELTASELNCLIQLTYGYSAKQIAYYVNLSQRTVETYIHNIKEKLGIRDTMHLTRFFTDALSLFKYP